MFNCFLCLESSEEIPRNDRDKLVDNATHLGKLIAVHLPFLSFHDDFDKVCNQCTQELHHFNLFFNKVKAKQENSTQECFVKCEALEQEENDELNFASTSMSQEASSNTRTEPIKRGMPKKTTTAEKSTRGRGRPRKVSVPGSDKEKDLERDGILPKKTYRRRTDIDDRKILESIDMKCDLCSETLESYSHALLHHQHVHNQKGYLVCCNRKFKQKSSLIDHLDYHSNPELFKCKSCEKNFSSLSNLRTHITQSHIAQTKYQCDKCGKQLNLRYRLTAHIKEHLVKTLKQKSPEVFVCAEPNCEKPFSAKKGLDSHMKNCHNLLRETFSCEICGKQLMKRHSLREHIKNTHAEGTQKIQCNICQHYIKNEYAMKKHLYRHKQMEQKCEYCAKKCSTKAALRSHLRMKHLLKRTFECHFCDKKFKQNIDLNEHEATHTGIDLYPCLWCTATFKFGANFRAHRKNVHPEEYEKIKPAWLRPN